MARTCSSLLVRGWSIQFNDKLNFALTCQEKEHPAMARFYFAVLLLFVVGCSKPEVAEPSTDSPQGTGSAAATGVDGASTDEGDVIVIDVRTKEEWDAGHVTSAVHIPHTEIAERIDEVTLDKDAKIVLYCKVGGRAGKAKDELDRLGFTNVENAGGYDDVKDRFAE